MGPGPRTRPRFLHNTSGIQRSQEMIGPISHTPVILPNSEVSKSLMFQPCIASNLIPTARLVLGNAVCDSSPCAPDGRFDCPADLSTNRKKTSLLAGPA